MSDNFCNFQSLFYPTNLRNFYKERILVALNYTF